MIINSEAQDMEMLYPVMLNLKGKNCLVVGGGRIALQKLETLILTGANIRVVAKDVIPQISELAGSRKIMIERKPYSSSDLKDIFIVFGATNDRILNKEIYLDALKEHILVNIVDTPDLCLFQVPASVKRKGLVISVSTSGKSPALAKKIRKDLEQQYPETYQIYLEWLDQWRSKMKRHPVLTLKDRENIFNEIVQYPVIEWINQDNEESAHRKFNLKMGQIVRQYLKK
jgi:precorrin-2 dehydrogenase/sirohydrochlorin ferrochelatase